MIKDSMFLGLSVILHLLVVLLMLPGSKMAKPAEPPKNAEKQVDGSIIPKILDVELFSMPKQLSPEGEPQKQVKKEDGVKKCKDDAWFGGIGIEVSWDRPDGELITKVVPGYPAFKAGLEKGDVINSVDGNPPTQGTPGTTLTLKIYRPSTGETFYKDLVRDRICVRD